MKKVLVIEDDITLARGLEMVLKYEGYEARREADGDTGLYAARTWNPDAIILDLMLPGMNGFEIITEIRRRGIHVPILVLSARDDSKDKVRALDLGADDYVAKPFDLDELLARVRRLLQRSHPHFYTFGRFRYDLEGQRLWDNNEEIPLSPREHRLLAYFLKREGRICTREEIIANVWGDEYEGSERTIDNFIVTLRKKIGKEHLLTIWGEGYRFIAQP